MVLGGKHLPHRSLLRGVRESRRTFLVEIKYGGGFFGLDRDVGDIVRMDSGDFPDTHEGFSMWNRFCFVKSVRCPPSFK